MNTKRGLRCAALLLGLALPALYGQAGTIRTDTGIELARIPGGWFAIGAERPVRVWVDTFYMAVHPVTQQAFETIMGSNPSRWQQADHPVERITWAGAATFCNRLSRREGLQPVYCEDTWEINYEADGYRLPTEAEWEFAARAGTETPYFWGDDPRRLRFFAWTKDNSGGRTRPVGRKFPNPLGLYDVYGNVWEWCNDYYREELAVTEGQKNPRGPADGDQRVVRGGSWDSTPRECTSFYRGQADPGYADICTAAYDVYGFRIVKSKRAQ